MTTNERVIVDVTPANIEGGATAEAGAMALVKIADVEQRLAASEHLRGIRLLKRKIEAHYDAIKRPLLDTISKVRRMEADDLRPVVQADAHLVRVLSEFDRAEADRKARELRAREEEERKKLEARRHEEAEALRRAAREEEDARNRRALHAQARAVEAAPIVPVVAPSNGGGPVNVAGVSSTRKYRAHVTDRRAAILAAAAGELLRATYGLVPPVQGRDEVEAFLRRFMGGDSATPLPFEAIDISEPILNQLAKRLESSLVAPGVHAVTVDGFSVRR
jgi:phage FluMu protein gp41